MQKCFLNIKSCSFPRTSTSIKKYYKYKNIFYRKCNKCDLVFQYPIPKEKETFNFYKGKYFILHESRKKLRLKQYKLDKKILNNFFKDSHNTKVLDYGCGNGEFIKLFRKSKKVGFEVNKSIKYKKYISYIENVKKLKKNTFDLIIMRGVIEHIPNFDTIVKNLISKLKKNGIFFITATPNANNLSMFLSKSNFNQNSKGHIFHFNNTNISLFMLNNNLYNIFTSFQYYNTPYANISKDYIEHKKMRNNFYNKTNYKKKTPPSVGNMMTLVFKKL